MPLMGSTRVQEDAEDQGVRRQKEDQQEEPRKRAPKRNQEEEPKKEKPPASIEGKLILEGGKILR